MNSDLVIPPIYSLQKHIQQATNAIALVLAITAFFSFDTFKTMINVLTLTVLNFFVLIFGRFMHRVCYWMPRIFLVTAFFTTGDIDQFMQWAFGFFFGMVCIWAIELCLRPGSGHRDIVVFSVCALMLVMIQTNLKVMACKFGWDVTVKPFGLGMTSGAIHMGVVQELEMVQSCINKSEKIHPNLRINGCLVHQIY